MSRPVCCRASALGGRSLAESRRHAAERALVDFALLGARERHAVVFQLDDGIDGGGDHVFDRVLITEPVRTLDRVVHMPSPVVLAHVGERSRDAALRGNRVAARREELRDAGGAEPRLDNAQRRPEPATAGTDDKHIVGMVGQIVGERHRSSLKKRIVASGLQQDTENSGERGHHEEKTSPMHAEQSEGIERGRGDVVFDNRPQPKRHVMQREDDRQIEKHGVDRIVHPKQKLGVVCSACVGKRHKQQPHIQRQQGYGGDPLDKPMPPSCPVSVGKDEETCKAYCSANDAHVKASSTSKARQGGARRARSCSPKGRRLSSPARAPYPRRGGARRSAYDRSGTK